MAQYQAFEETFSLDDFVTATDTSLTDDEFRTVETLDPDKQEMVQLGMGQARNQTDAIGRLYADPANGSATTLSGKMRFVVVNQQNHVVRIISQHQIGSVTSGSGDRSQRRPYALKPQKVADGYKIAVQIKLSSGTDTYSSADSSMEVDGYRYEAVA